MGPPFVLLREASCRLTCTHTTTYAHTQLTDTVRYRHVDTATQLSALPFIPRAWAGAAWTQSRSLSHRALCLGAWRRAELRWGDGLRDCTALTWSGEVSAQKGVPRGTQIPSRQTVLGARCPKIAMARLFVSLAGLHHGSLCPTCHVQAGVQLCALKGKKIHHPPYILPSREGIPCVCCRSKAHRNNISLFNSIVTLYVH